MESVRRGIQKTLVYFGLAESASEPSKAADPRMELVGMAFLLVLVPSAIGSRRGAVAGVVLAAMFLPTAILTWRAPGSTAHRWAELTAGTGAVFALVTMMLSRHASLWIPIACASLAAALGIVRELRRDHTAPPVDAAA